jgi:hypothetical protein
VSPAVRDADAVRCDVLVELGQARRSAGLIREAHRAFEESISLADRIGDQDRMLAAAVAFGAPKLWGSREWGETDTALIALLERQLDRIADSDPARRVRILATLATELYFDQAAFRGWSYANQALDEARRLGRPEELGIAFSIYLWSARITDHVRQIRSVIDEMLGGHQPRLTPRTEAIVRTYLLTERIRSAELARFDTEFPQVWRLATDVLHSPELQGQLSGVEAGRYLAAGDAERCVGLFQLVFRAFGDPANPWREPQRIVLDNRMLITGTLADHAEQLAARLAQPDHPRPCPIWPSPPPPWASRCAATPSGPASSPPAGSRRRRGPGPGPSRSPSGLRSPSRSVFRTPSGCMTSSPPTRGNSPSSGGGCRLRRSRRQPAAGLAWRLGRLGEAAERAQAGLALETRDGSRIWIKRSTELISRIKTAP